MRGLLVERLQRQHASEEGVGGRLEVGGAVGLVRGDDPGDRKAPEVIAQATKQPLGLFWTCELVDEHDDGALADGTQPLFDGFDQGEQALGLALGTACELGHPEPPGKEAKEDDCVLGSPADQHSGAQRHYQRFHSTAARIHERPGGLHNPYRNRDQSSRRYGSAQMTETGPTTANFLDCAGRGKRRRRF